MIPTQVPSRRRIPRPADASADEDVDVAINYVGRPEGAEETKESIEHGVDICMKKMSEAGTKPILVAADVSNAGEVAAMFEQVLSEYGVKFGDVVNPTWQTLRWAHPGDANGPVSGYQFYGRPASCSSGSLYVSVTTGCEISNMHTEGGCMIKGIPNHWW